VESGGVAGDGTTERRTGPRPIAVRARRGTHRVESSGGISSPQIPLRAPNQRDRPRRFIVSINRPETPARRGCSSGRDRAMPVPTRRSRPSTAFLSVSRASLPQQHPVRAGRVVDRVRVGDGHRQDPLQLPESPLRIGPAWSRWSPAAFRRACLRGSSSTCRSRTSAWRSSSARAASVRPSASSALA